MKLWIGSDASRHDVISIYGDRDGLIELVSDLALLVAGEPDNDLHLMTPSFGGDELAEEAPGKGETLVHQLNVYRLDYDTIEVDEPSEEEL
ncbi:MAG: hypothetical protein ACRDFX_08095 [Chloroflexota bacterium]